MPPRFPPLDGHHVCMQVSVLVNNSSTDIPRRLQCNTYSRHAVCTAAQAVGCGAAQDKSDRSGKRQAASADMAAVGDTSLEPIEANFFKPTGRNHDKLMDDMRRRG